MKWNVVVQTAFLGDLLLAIPLLKRCRELWPEQPLALVCRKGVGGFFASTGLVNKVIEVQKGDRSTYVKGLKELRALSIQNLLAPHQSTRTLLFCAQLKAERKIGFRNWLGRWVFDESIVKDLTLPDSIRQLSLLSGVSAEVARQITEFKSGGSPYEASPQRLLPAPPVWASMSLREQLLKDVSAWESLHAKMDLQGFSENRVVLLFPGSVWATKRWTEEGFIGVGKTLKAQGYQVYVMGGPGEEALAEGVAEAIGDVRSLAGKTKIYESALMIARARLLVGNDSASTHLAAVAETPLIAVFGPTVLEFGFRPWSAQSYVVEDKTLSCRPCGKHGHHHCPIGTHVCMKGISSQTVSETALDILKN